MKTLYVTGTIIIYKTYMILIKNHPYSNRLYE